MLRYNKTKLQRKPRTNDFDLYGLIINLIFYTRVLTDEFIISFMIKGVMQIIYFAININLLLACSLYVLLIICAHLQL